MFYSFLNYLILLKKIGIIINAEAQSIHNIKYDVLNRAHYYNARNISSQYKTLWEDNNYDELRKVVSIWFILDANKKDQGNLNRYVMKEEHIIGNTCENQNNIEKNEIIMVYLSKDNCDNEFIQLMSDIKNRNVNFDELKIKLANKYDITIDEHITLEVDQMCNYGSYVFNEGKIEQAYENILNVMKNFNTTFEQAIKSLNLNDSIEIECRKRYELEKNVK